MCLRVSDQQVYRLFRRRSPVEIVTQKDMDCPGFRSTSQVDLGPRQKCVKQVDTTVDVTDRIYPQSRGQRRAATSDPKLLKAFGRQIGQSSPTSEWPKRSRSNLARYWNKYEAGTRPTEPLLRRRVIDRPLNAAARNVFESDMHRLVNALKLEPGRPRQARPRRSGKASRWKKDFQHGVCMQHVVVGNRFFLRA